MVFRTTTNNTNNNNTTNNNSNTTTSTNTNTSNHIISNIGDEESKSDISSSSTMNTNTSLGLKPSSTPCTVDTDTGTGNDNDIPQQQQQLQQSQPQQTPLTPPAIATATATAAKPATVASTANSWTMGGTVDVQPQPDPSNNTNNIHNSNMNMNPIQSLQPSTAPFQAQSQAQAQMNASTNSAAIYNAAQKFEIGMKVRETPSPLSTPSMSPSPSALNVLPNIPMLPAVAAAGIATTTATSVASTTATTNAARPQQQPLPSSTSPTPHTRSKYEDKLSNLGLTQPSQPVETVLAAACESIGFDIVEMWLRTGPKTHQLIHSHLRHSALDDTTRSALVDVYYGDNAPNRTHKLSPALCKKARANKNIVWVTAQTYYGAQALKCSLNGVLSAVAVPVCHNDSFTNMTVIYFSVRKAIMQPVASEFLIHMSLAAAIVSVNIFDHDLIDVDDHGNDHGNDREGGEQGHEHEHNEGLATNSQDINDTNTTNHSYGMGHSTGASTIQHMEQQYHSMNLRTQLSQDMTHKQQQQQQQSQQQPFVTQPAAAMTPSATSVSSAKTLPVDVYRPRSTATLQGVPPNITTTTTKTDIHTHTNTNHSIMQRSTLHSPLQSQQLQQQLQLQPQLYQHDEYSVTGAHLQLKWNDLRNVEYLTDGGNNWIHTAVLDNNPVVIKQLKPEVHDVVSAMDEIESELSIHSQLDHRNIVTLHGAGHDRKGARFIILERLDGGTLSQLLGYDTRIRDRRRRFFRKRDKLPYVKILKHAQQIAASLDYLHRNAIDGSMIIHRDLKPDNIGFTLDGTVKVMDFGLSTVVPNSSPDSDEAYDLSGETGSLRYMAPEVATRKHYNHKADVYSFGIMLWELVTFQKPFDKMNREEYYQKVVHGGYRPEITKKFPNDLAKLIRDCWDIEPKERPTFQSVVLALAEMLGNEKSKKSRDNKGSRVGQFVKRHSTWF